jgi:type II secretory pathway pseudopilin PulG
MKSQVIICAAIAAAMLLPGSFAAVASAQDRDRDRDQLKTQQQLKDQDKLQTKDKLKDKEQERTREGTYADRTPRKTRAA